MLFAYFLGVWQHGLQNAAMFPVDDPTSPPLIGPSTIVVVNDARHQLQPEFLQRTTPYFFDVDPITQQYKWAKVCEVSGLLTSSGGTSPWMEGKIDLCSCVRAYFCV